MLVSLLLTKYWFWLTPSDPPFPARVWCTGDCHLQRVRLPSSLRASPFPDEVFISSCLADRISLAGDGLATVLFLLGCLMRLHYFPKAQLWSPLCWKYPVPPPSPCPSPSQSPLLVLCTLGPVSQKLSFHPSSPSERVTHERVETLRDLPVSPPHPQFACYKRPSVAVYQGIMSVLPLSSSSPSVHVLENLIHLWFQGNIKVNKTDLRVLRHLPPLWGDSQIILQTRLETVVSVMGLRHMEVCSSGFNSTWF